MSDRERCDIGQYAFLKYMEVICSIETLEETLRCVCERGCIDDEVEHSLGRGTGALDREHLVAGEVSGMKSVQTLQGCVNIQKQFKVLNYLWKEFRGHFSGSL